MTSKVCAACGELLPLSARVDKTTCGPACRTRLYRQRKAARDGFVTPWRAVAPRSGGGNTKEPTGYPRAGRAAPFNPGTVAPLAMTGRPRRSPSASLDDTSQQLAIWLADVSVEAAGAPMVPEAGPTPMQGFQRPRVAESPR